MNIYNLKKTVFLGLLFLLFQNISFADLTVSTKKLNFTEHGAFYGIKENGKKIRGIYKGPQGENGQSDWYGLFTENEWYWKGYFKHTYPSGKILYQYTEYKIDDSGNAIKDKDGKFILVDKYLISEEEFKKVKRYISHDIPIPFSFYKFEEDVADDKEKKETVSVDYACLSGNCKNGYGKAAINEQTYEGNFKNGSMNGFGKLTDHEFKIQTSGEWKDNDLSKGKIVFLDTAAVWNGEIKNSRMNGDGVLIFYVEDDNKNYNYDNLENAKVDYIYTGKVKNKKFNGEGKLELIRKNKVYEGNFINGKLNGQGTITSEMGTLSGNFVDDNLEGTGEAIFYNGIKYVGGFKKGILHGPGTLIQPRKNHIKEIEGIWVQGVLSYGTVIEKSLDNKYLGKYVGDLDGYRYHGKGKIVYSFNIKEEDLKKYEGEEIKSYDGDWKFDKRNGFGIVELVNGDTYTGEFKDNLRHGFGKIVYADGTVYEGEWRFSKRVDLTEDLKLSTNEKYYALVIGNNNYKYIEKLDAAVNDAKVVSDLLEKKYGFETELLLDANYDETVNSLYKITKKLKKNDNLLIYYAGHGELDKSENRGYWLPVDASYEMRSKWVSNQIIVDRIKATKAKHVLLIADSCFSGTLMRSSDMLKEQQSIDQKYIERLKNKKTRLVITSGGNEPVVDSDGGNHSLFALKLIDTLKNNNEVINSQILFENIRRYVVANADQTPERAMVHKTGHDGGDFLFFPVN